MTINQYALKNAPIFNKFYERFFKMHDSCNDKILLRYENLIQTPNDFIAKLNGFAKISQEAQHNLFHASRPLESIHIHSHKRSAKTNQYMYELNSDTITQLNLIFKEVLKKLDYQVY
jgi:hypothetical protein